MHMKIARKFAQAVSLAVVSLAASTAMATQTVTPYTAATGGAAITAATVPAGSVFTFFGRYEVLAGSTGNESGLGLKVKYDKTKFSTVTVDQVYTKCMIAAPDKQETVPATSQIVFGWIDTSIRRTATVPNGVVGWPATADPAAPGAADGCLNPGSIVVDQAGVAPPLSLFRVQMTTLPGFTSGTTTVNLNSDGNYSYAGTTPGFTDKSIVLTGAAAPACNLDVDANGGVTAFRDGILIMRYMLGLTGTSLIAGMSPAPNATTVQNNIAAILPALDVNGNTPAAQTAFVDGILLVRMMLGLNGTALTSGVNLTGSARTTSAQLVGYVNTTCGTSFTP